MNIDRDEPSGDAGRPLHEEQLHAFRQRLRSREDELAELLRFGRQERRASGAVRAGAARGPSV